MPRSDSPFLADWFAISLRWMALFGVLLALSIQGQISLFPALVLIAGGVWNVIITMLAIFNRRLPLHRLLNVTMDFLAGALVFLITGGMNGPLVWAFIIPFFSAAIYYTWKGTLLIAVLGSLLQAGIVFYSNNQAAYPVMQMVLVAGFNLLAAVVLGFLSHQLIQNLRQAYFNQVRLRRETEMKTQQSERNRMQTFYTMIETVAASLDYHTVVDMVLDLSVNALGGADSPAIQMMSAVLMFGDRSQLTIASARRLSPRDMHLNFPAELGVLHEVVRRAEPVLVDEPSKDPELAKVMMMDVCKKAFVLPLHHGLNAYGVMLFAHPDPAFFNQERQETLEMISHQAVISIQNARLYQDLAQEKKNIVESQDEARKKLARDLHDGPIQSVSAIVMRVEVVNHMMGMDPKDMDPKEIREEIERIEDLARRTTQELRHMLFTLRPLVLETEGLVAGFKAIAEKMGTTFQQKVEIDADQSIVDKLELGKQTVVFYLVEEAVNNARKHAKAPTIWVRLKYLAKEQSFALLEIADNGVGFDVKSLMSDYERRGSLGMVNLRERTDIINGLLQIDSAPGKGTRVRIVIPLTEQAADRLQRGKISS